MTVDEKQIVPSDFINNEVKTLGFIQNQATLASNFPMLCAEASTTYDILRGRSHNTKFSFGCELALQIEGSSRTVFVEGLIENNYSPATYALSICDSKESGKSVIRKFHFDYDPNAKDSIDKKPLYHLQYGGKTTPRLERAGLSSEHLQDWLSVPRIPHFPINLALLLDFIFNEFPSEETKKVSEQSEWRDLIKKNEELLLKPYYSNINQFFSSSHSSSFLFRELVYGNDGS